MDSFYNNSEEENATTPQQVADLGKVITTHN